MPAPTWMPFYVADYLADTGHLSTEEHGAYLLLICHYWRHGGLPANEQQLLQICHSDATRWPGILLTMRSLFSPQWRHKRIDAELAKARDLSQKRQKAGISGAEKRYGKPVAIATDLPKPSHRQSQSQLQEKKRTPSGVPKEKAPNGTLLAEEWRPPLEAMEQAASDLGSSADVEREFDRFRDHWRSTPAGKARKRDWLATWRNWVRNAVDRKGKSYGNKRESPADQLMRIAREDIARGVAEGRDGYDLSAWNGADNGTNAGTKPRLGGPSNESQARPNGRGGGHGYLGQVIDLLPNAGGRKPNGGGTVADLPNGDGRLPGLGGQLGGRKVVAS